MKFYTSCFSHLRLRTSLRVFLPLTQPPLIYSSSKDVLTSGGAPDLHPDGCLQRTWHHVPTSQSDSSSFWLSFWGSCKNSLAAIARTLTELLFYYLFLATFSEALKPVAPQFYIFSQVYLTLWFLFLGVRKGPSLIRNKICHGWSDGNWTAPPTERANAPTRQWELPIKAAFLVLDSTETPLETTHCFKSIQHATWTRFKSTVTEARNQTFTSVLWLHTWTAICPDVPGHISLGSISDHW